jgi:hypothetical protein
MNEDEVLGKVGSTSSKETGIERCDNGSVVGAVEVSTVAEIREEGEDCCEAASVAGSRLVDGIEDEKDGVSSHVEVACSEVDQSSDVSTDGESSDGSRIVDDVAFWRVEEPLV